MTTTNDPTIPTWKLERFALGELPADELAVLQRRMETDTELRGQLEALQADNAAILESYPAPRVSRQVQEQLQQQAQSGADRQLGGSGWISGSWARRYLMPVIALEVVSSVAVPSMFELGDAGEIDARLESAGSRFLTEGVHSKGTGATLYAHGRTESGIESLVDQSPARPGDLVRLQYEAAGSAYGVILSIDGGGTVTLHLPLEGEHAAILDDGGLVSLDTAYELDDAPRWERFFLLTGSQPFSLDAVLHAAEKAATVARTGGVPKGLSVSEELEQATLTLIKPGVE
jgi:hypothetical protein